MQLWRFTSFTTGAVIIILGFDNLNDNYIPVRFLRDYNRILFLFDLSHYQKVSRSGFTPRGLRLHGLDAFAGRHTDRHTCTHKRVCKHANIRNPVHA